MSILNVEHLSTQFTTDQGVVKAVRDVSFSVEKGEILGIVGESGSGKSVTMFSIMGLLAGNGQVTEGKILLDGDDLSPSAFSNEAEYEKKMCATRGNQMAMIFQDPMTFLNPVLRIETQVVEPILNHTKLSRKEAVQRAIELMAKVGIPSPEKRIKQYPHQFSGGMRQRIIIAMALACNPKLIIADEPTTALDVTIQAQVLELIANLKEEFHSSVILITHDLGVVAQMCDHIAIMYGGKIVEQGTADDIFYAPNHPYTKGLLGCITNPDSDEDQPLTPIPGSPPDLLKPPAGCPFLDRCPHAMRVCRDLMPEVTVLGDGHTSRCWLNQKGGGAG